MNSILDIVHLPFNTCEEVTKKLKTTRNVVCHLLKENWKKF